MDADALACERRPFDVRGSLPAARRALVFHDRLTAALALGTSVRSVDLVRAVDCFDDAFALTNVFGQDPAAVVLVG